MQEDNKLKDLLQQFAMEDTTADFTQNIMQRIEAKSTAPQNAKPLVNALLLRVLAGAFAIVGGLLLIICFRNQLTAISLPVKLTLPENYVSQLTSFIIVFWIVLLSNILYQLKNKQAIKGL